MTVIFPAGVNKIDWVKDPEQKETLEKTAQVGMGTDMGMDDQHIEDDPQFEVIKGLPAFKD